MCVFQRNCWSSLWQPRKRMASSASCSLHTTLTTPWRLVASGIERAGGRWNRFWRMIQLLVLFTGQFSSVSLRWPLFLRSRVAFCFISEYMVLWGTITLHCVFRCRCWGWEKLGKAVTSATPSAEGKKSDYWRRPWRLWLTRRISWSFLWTGKNTVWAVLCFF